MLKLFFNRESKIVYIMEILGIIFTALLLITWWPGGRKWYQQIALFIYIAEYLFIKICDTMKWYKNAARYEGIRLSFRKVLVPTSYIIAVISLLLLIGAPIFVLYFAIILLTVIAHVNVILIYFHIKDKETLPINYFTHNKHLNDHAAD